MAQYRKHATSKATRKAHAKRLKKRKVKLGGLAAFAFDDGRGRSKKDLNKRLGRI